MMRLEPRTAIAFSEKEWRELLRLPTDCHHCWDPEYTFEVRIGGIELKRSGCNEYFICGPIDAPWARVIVFGIYDTPDLVINWQKKAVLDSLKRNRRFRWLLSRYKVARLLWAFADMFDQVRERNYPTFYVIVNDTKSAVEIF